MMKFCAAPGCSRTADRRGFCFPHYCRWKSHGDPLGGRTKNGDPIKFVNEVAIPYSGDDCLIWPYGRFGTGYPCLRDGNGHIHAHRYICISVHGEPPTVSHEAAHTCGQGLAGCVNPNHLEWKTRKENEADKVLHGTSPRGSRQGRAKLTEEQARKIISMKGTMSERDIAGSFGISTRHVRAIQSGSKWSWLSPSKAEATP